MALPSLLRRGELRRRHFASIGAVLLACVVTSAAAVAAGGWDYWMDQGAGKVVKCDGNTNGALVKLANKDGQWIYVDGIASCKDSGSDYVFDIKFLKVSVNSARKDDVERDAINFDWLGLAVYKANPAQQHIDWLYDDAKPIQGSLAKQSTQPIYFGKLQFVVPKDRVRDATRFTFYLTAQGIPFTFGVL